MISPNCGNHLVFMVAKITDVEGSLSKDALKAL
jgi:hypothetical protein